MIVRISSDALDVIDLNPATTAGEVAQNVAALALTPIGSCPILRGMGMGMEFMDRAMEAASELYEAELSMAVDAWEPRAFVVAAEGQTDEEHGWLIERLEVEVDG